MIGMSGKEFDYIKKNDYKHNSICGLKFLRATWRAAHKLNLIISGHNSETSKNKINDES